MFDSFTHPKAKAAEARVLPSQPAVAIYNGRAGFEAGITRLVESAPHGASECAVLYVALSGDALQDPEASRKTLVLAANILRARVKSGAVAYLGDAHFAVMLQGVSGRDTVAFCRDVLSVLEGIRLHWQGQVLTVEAWIGGAMAEIHHDGMILLEEAEHASRAARSKPGRKLHMVHEQEESAISVQEEMGLPDCERSQGSSGFSGRLAHI